MMHDISILYVEDEEGVHESLRRFIGRFASKLYVAKDGADGLEQFKTFRPELVISDIKMPMMDGITMVHEIKALVAEQPVIFTTAHSESGYFLEAIEMQVDGYILKPVDLDLLAKKIRSIIKLIGLKRKLQQQELYLEEITQLQGNMLFLVNDNHEVLFANAMSLSFFQVANEQEMMERYPNLSSFFIPHHDFFSPKNPANWMQEIATLHDDARIVSIMDPQTETIQAFLVNVKRIAMNGHNLITFSEITHLAIKKKEFEVKAYTDELTHIANRAKFNQLLEVNSANVKQHGMALSLIMFDIDHFKQFNDTYGHQVGDEVLVELAELVLNHTRSTDLFARWGGEEFVKLLPDTAIEGAIKVANLLCQAVENHRFSQGLKVTCSFGVTQMVVSDTREHFIKRCDQALYQAKTNGRNRVEVL
jgi:diguanylate cyclase (GGDEF)-like protein